jgi:hypothetical protein
MASSYPFLSKALGVEDGGCFDPTDPTVQKSMRSLLRELNALLSTTYDLTGIRLWVQICAHLDLELRKCLITFLLFVRCQRLIARNDRELFSFNRGISHLNNACRIDDVSRGSLSCYEILTNN